MKSSYRTPLGRVKGLGAARGGTRDNWYMRVTSAALIPLSIAFVLMLLSVVHKDYHAARAFLSHPLPAIVMLLFVVVGLYHTELGMRSVIVDYVKGTAREWGLIINSGLAILLSVACAYAILRISFVQ